MALVIYTKLKELQIQEKEIFEFGNWLKGFSNAPWDDADDADDEYDEDGYDDEYSEIPKNNEGEIMEYPWDDFNYVVIPDSNDDIKDALEVSQILGISIRYDIDDPVRVFFIVK